MMKWKAFYYMLVILIQKTSLQYHGLDQLLRIVRCFEFFVTDLSHVLVLMVKRTCFLKLFFFVNLS